MANDNETVEQVLERMTRGMGRDCSVESQLLESNVVEYADRILTAHNRELSAKNAMIAEQSAVNESQAAQLRDALNEGEELKCAIADSKRISDAVVKSLRDKKLEMAGQIAAKDAEIENLKKENARLRVIVSGATVADGNLREEIERLREIVKELADELETMICNEIVKSSKRHGK